MSCFNVIFTFLPPLVIGIFDQFVSARMLDKYPQMYMLGQSNEFFNQKKFWGWFGNAVFHSLVSFFFFLCVVDEQFTNLPHRSCSSLV